MGESAAFRRLKREHHDLLDHLEPLEKALEQGRSKAVPHLIRRLLTFWDDVLAFHIDLEEQRLLRHEVWGQPEELRVARRNIEHVHLVVARLRRIPAAADVRVAVRAAARLREYVEYEEEVLFPWLIDAFGETEILEVLEGDAAAATRSGPQGLSGEGPRPPRPRRK